MTGGYFRELEPGIKNKTKTLKWFGRKKNSQTIRSVDKKGQKKK